MKTAYTGVAIAVFGYGTNRRGDFGMKRLPAAKVRSLTREWQGRVAMVWHRHVAECVDKRLVKRRKMKKRKEKAG